MSLMSRWLVTGVLLIGIILITTDQTSAVPEEQLDGAQQANSVVVPESSIKPIGFSHPTALSISSSSTQPIDTIALDPAGRSRAYSVAFAPNGQILAVGSDLGTGLYAADSLKPVQLIPSPAWVRSVAISPNGDKLETGSYDNVVRVYHFPDVSIERELTGHTDRIHSVVFSPDGQRLVSSSEDNTLRIWNVATGQLLRTISSYAQGVRSVAFSPDGQLLAAGLSDQTVRIWHVSDGTLWHTLNGHTDWVRTVAFSPDGQLLASGSFDKTARLWRVADGALLQTLTGHTSSVLSVAFSPDGQILSSGSVDTTIRLWRVADGSLLKILNGHTNFVFSVAFSPDGQTLASGSADNTARVWNVANIETAPALPAPTPTPVVTASPRDCVTCHHPRNDYQPAAVLDVRCEVCHADGASMFWDPDFPRNPDLLATPTPNRAP